MMRSFAQHHEHVHDDIEDVSESFNLLLESRLEKALPKNIRNAITAGSGGRIRIYQIGGAVRDEILGKVSKDLDLLITGIDLTELEKRLKPYGKVNLVGKSFGILKFKPEGTDEDLDISVPRIDSKSTGKGHKEFEVKLGKGITLQQDQMRRDFWMNALSKDIITGKIHDIKGKGQLNIANKEVEMISLRAFQEDPLRMLRAIQFAARFDFKIEEKTFKEIQKNAKNIKTVAPERFQEEFKKMFEKSKNVAIGIDYLFSTGIMKYIFPKVKRNKIDTKTMNRLSKKAFPAFLAVLLGPDYGAENAARVATIELRITKNDALAVTTVEEYRNMGFAMDDISFVRMVRQDANIPANVLKNLDAFAIASGASKRLIPSVRLAIMKKKKIPSGLSQLKVTGGDMTSIGLKGRPVGDALQHLLRFAIRTGKNDKTSLMKEIKRKHRIKEEHDDIDMSSSTSSMIMKSFSQHELEEEIAWLQSASEHIFAQPDIMLPLSSKMFKRLFGDPPRKTVFHVTSPEHIKDIVKLQGKKKSISALTYAHPTILGWGINAGGGIVFELDANILVSAPHDIMSRPDKTGRRWLEAYYIPDVRLKNAVSDEGAKEIAKLYKKYTGKKVKFMDRRVFSAWNALDPRNLQSRTRIKTDDKKSQGKLLFSMVKDYIDVAERIMKKHAKEFKDVLWKYALNPPHGTSSSAGWDELVVNKINIKKVHILKAEIQEWLEKESPVWQEKLSREFGTQFDKMLDKAFDEFLEQEILNRRLRRYEVWDDSLDLAKYISAIRATNDWGD